MIRVMVVDDHPSMREGLTTVLKQGPDIEPVGAAANLFDAWNLFKLARPDVVMLDFHLPGENSLRFAYKLKQQVPVPQVLLHSAHTGPALDLGTLVAGADGALDKSVETRELFETLRAVASGGRLPIEDLAAVRAAADAKLSGDEREVASMIVDGATREQVGQRLGVPAEAVVERIDRVLEALSDEPIDTLRPPGA